MISLRRVDRDAESLVSLDSDGGPFQYQAADLRISTNSPRLDFLGRPSIWQSSPAGSFGPIWNTR